ncbi:MAG: hypothetical protein ABFC34_08465 [Methanobacterium sp.]
MDMGSSQNVQLVMDEVPDGLLGFQLHILCFRIRRRLALKGF